MKRLFQAVIFIYFLSGCDPSSHHLFYPRTEHQYVVSCAHPHLCFRKADLICGRTYHLRAMQPLANPPHKPETKLRSENTGLEQPNSLLKSAREIGWKDPQKGLRIIEEAESEARRIIAISNDLEEIQSDALNSVIKSEEISNQIT